MLKIRNSLKKKSPRDLKTDPLKSDMKRFDNFIAQMLSGHVDDKEYDLKGNVEPPKTVYTAADYKSIAASIFYQKFGLSPEQLFRDIQKGYDTLNNDFDRSIYLNNLKIFVNDLIDVDVGHEFLPDTKKEFDKFIDNVLSETDNEAKNPNSVMHAIAVDLKIAIGNKVNQSYKDKYAREEKLKRLKSKKDAEQDINYFLHTTLADKSSGKIRQQAVFFAKDLKQIQAEMIGDMTLKKAWDIRGVNPLTTSFNNLSDMVMTDILSAKNEKHQKRIFEFYVRVINESIKLGDYQSAYAVYSGLENHAVNRLEYLKDQPDVVTRMLEKAEKLFSPSKGYATYRANKDIRTNKNSDIIPLMNVMAMDVEKISQIDIINPNTNKLRSDGLEGLGISVVNNILNPLLALTKQTVKPLTTNIRSKMTEPVLTSDAADALSQKLYSSKQINFSEQESREQILDSISLVEPNNETLQGTSGSVSVENSNASKSEPEENQTSVSVVSSEQAAQPQTTTSRVQQKAEFFEGQSVKNTASREKRAPSVTTSYPSVEHLRAQFESKMSSQPKEPSEQRKKKPGFSD